MPKREKPFAKGASMSGRHTVYAREEELLLIDGYYVEKYRRFPYEDIQAILWTEDKTFKGLNIGLAVILGLIAFVAFLNGAIGVMVIFLIMTAMPTLSLVVYALQGGKIKAFIITPAQQTSLNFIRTKRKLDKLFHLLNEKGVMPPAHGSPDV